VKHRLPTVPGASRRGHAQSKGAGHGWSSRPADREELTQPVVAIAHINQHAAAARLATQLCAAFVREGATVSALVSVDNPAGKPDAEAAMIRLLEAGAQQAKWVRKPERDAQLAFATALEQLAGSDWLIAFGNTVPQLFKPMFTVVVTGHRRGLTDVEPLVLLAQLEVTAPGDELATLLARRLIEQRVEDAAKTAET
jgi:hypothetical protein